MSSHHVVRDNQEPALILDKVAFNDYPLVRNLLEWSPYTILNCDAIDVIRDWGIKIDLLFHEENSNKLKTIAQELAYQEPFEKKIIQKELLLSYLESKGHTMINYLGNFVELSELEKHDGHIVIYDNSYMYSRMKEQFNKWIPESTCIEVVGSNDYKFTGLTQDESGLLISDKSGIVSVQSKTPFWIKEKW